jgi:hypothetical protein
MLFRSFLLICMGFPIISFTSGCPMCDCSGPYTPCPGNSVNVADIPCSSDGYYCTGCDRLTLKVGNYRPCVDIEDPALPPCNRCDPPCVDKCPNVTFTPEPNVWCPDLVGDPVGCENLYCGY